MTTKLEAACLVPGKSDRDNALSAILEELEETLVNQFGEDKASLWSDAYNKIYTEKNPSANC